MEHVKPVVALSVILCFLPFALALREVEDYVKFFGWNSQDPTLSFISNFSSSIEEQGCDPKGNFSLVVHGWIEDVATLWVPSTIQNLLQHRDGCVFFMDYSDYSMQPYPGLLPYFSSLSEVLTKKFNQIGNFERQYCFGFSFGARLCAEAGIRVGNQSIDRMDLCDPAGPGFTSKHDPKPAAKHVACINTSNIKGTTIYNCHQNFRMGKCGKTQAGASRFPLGSHGLCPYFYNLAFTHDFVPNNHYNCSSTRILRSFVGNVKMGYMGDFDRAVNVGDIFIATAKYSPFIVVNGIIDNIDNSTTTLTPELTPTNFDQESKIFTNQFMIQ